MPDLPNFLNADLNERFAKIRKQYDGCGSVTIPDFLDKDFADEVYECLDRQVPWFFAKNGPPDGLGKIPHEQYKRLSRKAKLKYIPKKPTDFEEFRYAYEKFEVTPECNQYADKRYQPLVDLIAALNDEIYIAFLRKITGRMEGDRVGVQFSNYAAGHYLSHHTDAFPGSDRLLVAHVLGLTREWKKEWGGCLCFCEEDGKAIERLVPRFNSLVLFDVPRVHYVQPVKSYVKQSRYSAYGWFEKPL